MLTGVARCYGLAQMPRACPVEVHVRSYRTLNPRAADATGLSRGGSRSLLHPGKKISAADATGQARGLCCGWCLEFGRSERESPRDKPVASDAGGFRVR